MPPPPESPERKRHWLCAPHYSRYMDGQGVKTKRSIKVIFAKIAIFVENLGTGILGLLRQMALSFFILVLVSSGAVAAAIAKTRLPAWIEGVAAGATFTVGLVFTPLWQKYGISSGRRAAKETVIKDSLRMRRRNGRLPKVRRCSDAIALGVHPARNFSPDGDLRMQASH